jgi:uncharacterized membrane protein YhaH (DUF805 family)
VGFGEAIKTAFAKFATFEGRATRSEFWWFWLFVTIITAIPYALVFTALPSDGEDVGGAFWLWTILLIVLVLVFLIPYISVTVRRLHDTDRSGWWYWISLVPCIGGIWLLILLILPGAPGQNRFG